MSFNKIYLQEVDEEKRRYEEDPKSFKKRIEKADSIIGPADSMKFVEEVMKNNILN